MEDLFYFSYRGGILLSAIQNIDTYKNTLKQYSNFQEIHKKNIEFRKIIPVDDKTILCTNIGVRGYMNILFDRSIYEGIASLQRCKELAKDRKAEKAIFISSKWVFSDIPEFLGAEGYVLVDDKKYIYNIPKYISAYNLTDNNWQNGISIRENGFFIGNSGNINIKKDDKLEFPTGKRKVVNVQNTGAYINIFVDGEKLDPTKDGYPNKIKLIKE